MWPFVKKPSALDQTSALMDEAILYTADHWTHFCQSANIGSMMTLREKILTFGEPFETRLRADFPQLVAASDTVMWLIIASGVAESRTYSRRLIEQALGITLPR